MTDTSATGTGPWKVQGTFIGYLGLDAVQVVVEETFNDEMITAADISTALEPLADAVYTAMGYVSGL